MAVAVKFPVQRIVHSNYRFLLITAVLIFHDQTALICLNMLLHWTRDYADILMK